MSLEDVHENVTDRIVHSPMLNDFLVFYIETAVDGTPKYETVIEYYPELRYTIRDLISSTESTHSFSDEQTVESEIHTRIHALVLGQAHH